MGEWTAEQLIFEGLQPDSAKEIAEKLARLAEAESAIRSLYRAQYRNGTHGVPAMVSVDATVWRDVGGRFQSVINAVPSSAETE